ncbi:hypothetical protein PHYPSEUDO_003144 [Phytophthora pseudosyringae]|uniref:Transmembrane protein n=1 Tax=Phytophthora pseudosyringae TaxID=221518 RepID=A0A8T1VRJ7_9STRA|nr:hypothetical protein PHYPSEUDO_003144 [Phytophthora pseudosyringae]
MIILVISQESVPLQDPAEGWRANYGIWVRSGILGAVVTHGLGLHAMHMLNGVCFKSLQLGILAIATAATYVAVLMVLAANWTFPIPFMGISCSLALIAALLCWFRIIAGSQTCQNIVAEPQLLVKFVCFVSTQLMMALIYPIYQVLFNYERDSNYVLPVILLLPVIKLTMKNILTRTLSHLEDLMPESVIYTVDFFNSLYVATCMQSATSNTTVAAIMAIDFAQSAVELYEMHRTTMGIRARLHLALGTKSASEGVLVTVRTLCERHKQTKKMMPDGIRLHSCLHSRYEVLKQSRGFSWCRGRSIYPVFTPPNSISPSPSHISGTKCIHQAVVHPKTAAPTKDRKSSDKTASSSGALSVSQQRALRHMLEVLFTSECIILTEYLEFVIPMLYGTFMVVAVHLPSAKYHTELEGITQENVGGTVKSLFVYSLLELTSFVVVLSMMHRNCGMNGLYQLAFVLETQMPFIQGKQLIWILMTLAFRIVHFGVDFTFQFNWIGKE